MLKHWRDNLLAQLSISTVSIIMVIRVTNLCGTIKHTELPGRQSWNSDKKGKVHG